MISLWRAVFTACVVAVLLTPAPVSAQAKDEFARGVVDAINADQAPPETRRAAMAAAIEAMAAGLKSWDAAVAKVEAGLASDIKTVPPSVASRMRMALGAVYLERGRFDAAAAQFAQAAALNPSSPDPHVYRGLALEQIPRNEGAANAYREAWQRDMANAVNAYRFVRASRGRASTETTAQALAALLRAVESPGRPFELLTVELLDDRQSAVPVMPLEAHADAFMLLRRGRYDEALARFREAAVAGVADRRVQVQTASGSLPLLGAAPLLARLGREAHVRLDLDAAIAAYERRTAIVANDSVAHYELAEVYRANDASIPATAEAAAAALLDPSAAKPRLMIGQLYAAAGRDADAARMLERVIAMAPEDAEARYALSRAYLRTGRREQAQRELDVFRQLQAKAMDDERRRFEDDFRKIEEALKAPPKKAQPGGKP